MYHSKIGEPQAPQAAIPLAVQPSGAKFFWGTWTGRIILLNTLLFVATAWQSSSVGLLGVDLNTLLSFGAKDSVLLARGQYWRLLTPMFIHGGLVHYAFNNWALYVLGYQIESLIRPSRYLALYLLAGVGGNILSAVTSVNVSVGASGALFGLLGCGFYIERTIKSRVEEMTGSKLRTGAYSGMVVANILFGFVIPQIDNAAHLGGLLVGVTFAYVLLRIEPNRLVPQQPRRAALVLGVASFLFIAGGVLSCTPAFVRYRLSTAYSRAASIEEKYFLASQLVRLAPMDTDSRFRRLRLAVILQDYPSAKADLEYLYTVDAYRLQIGDLVQELRASGQGASAVWLKEEIGRLESENRL